MIMSPSRRRLLSGAAAAALAPFLPLSSRRVEAAGAPRRLILFFTPNGMPRDGKATWWGATGTETQFTFGKTLQPLTPHQKDLLLLEGIDMKSYQMQVPQPPNDHPPVLGHVLTAADVIDPMDGSKPGASRTWFAGGISIDQMIANRIGKATKFPSMVLGVKSGGALARLSYRGPKDAVPAQNDPKKLFDQVFTGVTGDPGAGDKLRVQQRSVIDGVLGELKSLQGRVPGEDRLKIDAHLERLRAIELRLGDARVGAAGCRPPALVDDATQPAFVVEGRQQMDNIAMALACDLTRVVNLQWSVASTNMSFPWIGEMTGHHTLAHMPATDAVMERMSVIGAWYAGQLRYLIERLKEIPEGNGSVFDNTTILYYNEHGSPRSGHPRTNMPFLLAGGCGGAFRTGRWLQYTKASHSDLFISLAHAMGLSDVTTFGNPLAATGPLSGLA